MNHVAILIYIFLMIGFSYVAAHVYIEHVDSFIEKRFGSVVACVGFWIYMMFMSTIGYFIGSAFGKMLFS